MESRYQTLQTLYNLVKDTTNPTQYQCLPRQLVLLLHFDWGKIYSHLQDLQQEGFVIITHAESIQFSITNEGMAKASLLAVTEAKKISFNNQTGQSFR